MDLSPGTRLGPYEIVGPLGHGGMGEVYRARDPRLDRLIAIKVLSPRLVATATMVERFEREARTIAALNHPNICTIYDVGLARTDAPPYITMELLDGETLRARLERGPMPLAEVTDIGLALADALAAAHAHGIIHRDIKPSNIVLTARGPKILDFGLAKTSMNPAAASIDETRPGVEQLTEVGGTVGTIAYMSPEQIRGEELDARSDIFSLGLVLYEMVAGRAAFAGPTPMAIAAAILHDEPRPLSEHRSGVPVELRGIIGKTLERDRARRLQSAAELIADLKRFTREAEQGATRAPTTTSPRHRRLVAAAMLAVAIAAGALWWTRSSEPPVRSLAVLPFKDLSPGKDQQYFADSIAVTLINAFAALPDLDVRGQESSFSFRDRPSLRAVGDALNVQHVVTGAVLRADGQLRISASLEDVRTGSTIWSKTFDSTVGDVFQIQDEIAQSVARDLGVTLGLGDNAQPGMTRNLAAYDEFWKGIQLFGRLDHLDTAIAHFRTAAQIDSSFALPMFAIRDLYFFGAQFVSTGADEWMRRGTEALTEAQRRSAPDSPRLLMALADDRMRKGQWLEFGDLFARAFSRPVRTPNGPPWEGVFLLAAGKARDAVEPLRRALNEDPLNPTRSVFLAAAYDMSGQPERAHDEIELALKRSQGRATVTDVLAGTASLIAMSARNRAEIERWRALLPKGGSNVNRRLMGLLDDPAAARDAIIQEAKLPANQNVGAYANLTNWAAYYGYPELGLELMKRIVQMPAYNPGALLLWRPNVRSIRRLPGFKELVRQLGYVEYWRKYGWSDFCRQTGDDFVCE